MILIKFLCVTLFKDSIVKVWYVDPPVLWHITELKQNIYYLHVKWISLISD